MFTITKPPKLGDKSQQGRHLNPIDPESERVKALIQEKYGIIIPVMGPVNRCPGLFIGYKGWKVYEWDGATLKVQTGHSGEWTEVI